MKLFDIEPATSAAQLYREKVEDKKGDDDRPFMDTTMGKVTLGLAGAAIGAGAVYLYNKSQQADKA